MTLPLDNGIPQGSPLSIVLYTIYAHSIEKALSNTEGIDYVGIYADNIFVVASGKQTEVQIALNSIDFKIDNWSKIRDAVIPTNKTEILHICRQKACNCNTVRIRNVEHNIQDQMKILGIIFTKNLLWNNHTNLLINKLSKINNLLKLICSRNKGPHIETALKICKSLTIGILLHGITLDGLQRKTFTKSMFQ